MSPALLFSLACMLTAAAALSERILRRLHRARLRRMAAEWRMNYSPLDQFRLTARVASRFPIPGAARIRVLDLIYGIDADRYRYIFTAEYTAGIMTGKRRLQRAGSFSEPREREAGDAESDFKLAAANLPLLEQYRSLR